MPAFLIPSPLYGRGFKRRGERRMREAPKSGLVSLGSLKGRFVIPAYQRGYRWGSAQAARFLDDFQEFAAGGAKTFFLQPLVISAREGAYETYELIDGQQRLTTLFLLDAALSRLRGLHKSALRFELEYESRPGLKEFLAKLARGFEFPPEYIESSLDFHCLYEAWQSARAWLAGREPAGGPAAFHEKLLSRVKFLWHDAGLDKSSTPAQKFIRINSGRIPLSDGELCRALFLMPRNHDFSNEFSGGAEKAEKNAPDGPRRLRYKRLVTIGAEWDQMERALWDPAFWSFAGGGKYKDPVRMGLLLCLHNGIPAEDAGERPCFEKYSAIFKERSQDAGQAWAGLLQSMERLQYWFQDNDYYHWIGYLTAMGGPEKLSCLLARARELEEDEFKSLLREEIRASLSQDGPPPLDDLTFINNYAMCKSVLFLFNIEYSRTHQSHCPRFPFADFNLEACTIEHVFARNMESLAEAADRVQWIEEHAAFIREMEREPAALAGGGPFEPEEAFIRKKEELLSKAENALALIKGGKNKDMQADEFNAVSEALSSFIERPEDEEKHDLYNLALLDHDLNSYFKNSIFAIKQKKLRARLLEGSSFAPAATIALFMRHFARKRRREAWWTREDREDYRAAMRGALSVFWPELAAGAREAIDGEA